MGLLSTRAPEPMSSWPMQQYIHEMNGSLFDQRNVGLSRLNPLCLPCNWLKIWICPVQIIKPYISSEISKCYPSHLPVRHVTHIYYNEVTIVC